MKQALTYLVLGSLLTLSAGTLGAVPAEKVTVTGEVIELSGYAMRDARGEEDAEAGKFRALGGFPVGILTDEGEVYLALYKKPAPASPLETGNSILSELMGKQVVVRGRVYAAQGIKVLEISIVSEM